MKVGQLSPGFTKPVFYITSFKPWIAAQRFKQQLQKKGQWVDHLYRSTKSHFLPACQTRSEISSSSGVVSAGADGATTVEGTGCSPKTSISSSANIGFPDLCCCLDPEVFLPRVRILESAQQCADFIRLF
jgi:hypothetical protein